MASFQIRQEPFGLALYEADSAEEALLAFIADSARGEARFLIEGGVDGEASVVWNGIRYTTVRAPDRGDDQG